MGLLMILLVVARAHAADDSQTQYCDEQGQKLATETSEAYVVRDFIRPKPACSGKKALQSFCASIQTFLGYANLADDETILDPEDPDYAQMKHARDRAAKVCGTTTDAIRAGLCVKADAAKKWQWAYAECPVEGRRIFMRECLKPHQVYGEGGGRLVQDTEAQCTQQYLYQTRSKR